MRVRPFLFFVVVIAYAILACVVLATDKLAGGWPGIAIYAIGCVLVFLAFVRKRNSAGRKALGAAEQAQADQAGSEPPAASLERAEKIRERIRTRKSDGWKGQ